jgi:curli biogenesis system outer membrane secretion channel CsgG
MGKQLISVMLMFTLGQIALAEVPVSVISFKNKAGNVSCDIDWYWWRDNLGSAFQDMLLTELAKNPRVELLERENIEEINDMEVNLVNSEESSHKIEKGHFTKAKFTIAGAVTGYEYCADKKRVGAGVSAIAGFLGVGGAVGAVSDTVDEVSFYKAHAKVLIDVRVIETKTGRIVKSITTEGTAERSNFKVQSTLASYKQAQETPVGEAARNAIKDAAIKLGPVF